MKKWSFILIALLTIPVMAGRIISYTGLSTLSQKDANEVAMAGVAKQIIAKINSNETLIKQESSNGFDEAFFSTINVTSDIKLKGISVIPQKKEGNNFKAIAKIDLDELTSDIQFKIKQIQIDVKKSEDNAVEALKNRFYAQAINYIQSAKMLIPQHDFLIQKLSKIYPLNDNFLLNHNLSRIENLIQLELANIKIKGPIKKLNLSEQNDLKFEIIVYDKSGPLSGFPIIAKQENKILSEGVSDINGKVKIHVKNVNINTPPFLIEILPNISFSMLKTAGIYQGLYIPYDVQVKYCNIQINCLSDIEICSSLEKQLKKINILLNSSKTLPLLQFDYIATPKNTLTIGENKLHSYSVTFTLQNDFVKFQATTKGVGENEVKAISNALEKTDFSSFKNELKDNCRQNNE